MYIGVPTNAPLSVIDPVPASRAKPKSVIFTPASFSHSITLLGLTSRCTTPWSCANCSARATCAPISAALRIGIGPARRRSSSVSPSTNSITK
jgi:hypothetical protein